MTDFSLITACGECCVGCSKKKGGICPGCIEAEGKVPEWAESGICRVYACCREHDALFCGLCKEFPCEKLPQMIPWNAEIVNHLSELRDIYNAQVNSFKKSDNTIDKDKLKQVLQNWDIDNPSICEQYNEDSERLIFRIHTDRSDYILKGLPCSTSESTIKSNVQAHIFLGNENCLAPKIYQEKNGAYYMRVNSFWFYLIEYIDGRKMEETPEDEYKIAQVTRRLHSLSDYSIKSPMTQSKMRYYTWFRNLEFVKEFDNILDSLPDFEKLDQCFVHTDIGPHNTMMKKNGDVVFIDLDDSGYGSRYLDLGWPFIMQFVDYNDDTEKMDYRFDLAKSFLKGYFGDDPILREEYDRIFDGAIQMHISYMQSYGPYAVDSLWKILKFGIEQKEKLWSKIQSQNRPGD